jgi:hypothetical protein
MRPAACAAVLLTVAGPARAAPVEIWRAPLDADDGGLIPGGDTLQWAWGPVQDGPGAGVDGPSAWATGLASPTLNDATDWLQLPALPLGGLASPVLGFAHWARFGDGDAGTVEAWDGAAWAPLPTAEGAPFVATDTAGAWERAWFSLAGVDDLSHVRLRVDTDASVALDGWVIDDLLLVDGDPVPPRLAVRSAPVDTDDLAGPYDVLVWAVDDAGPVSGALAWSTPTDSGALPLEPGADDTFTAAIPAQPPGTAVTWSVAVTDGENTALTPPATFTVRLPAPTSLLGPEGRVRARSVALAWDLPTSRYPVLAHQIYRDGAPAERVGAAPEATVALAGEAPTYAVSAIFAGPDGAVEGDLSAPLTLDAAVPTAGPLEPDHGWPGDTLRVTLTGTHLLLVDGEPTLQPGPGITVDAIEVRDVGHATLTLRVAPDAAPGARSPLLTSGGVDIPLPGAFTVRGDGTAPHVRAVRPTALGQGARGTLTLTLSGPPPASAPLLLDLGPGVYVESLTADGPTLTATVVVGPDAPVGARDLLLDDGTRVWGGPSFFVRPQAGAESRACATHGGPPLLPLAPLAALLALPRARRAARSRKPIF